MRFPRGSALPTATGTIGDWVTGWLEERRSLLAAVRPQVLPEADVVLMNPRHPDAARVPPLITRPFSFAECLHTPPMLARYSGESDVAEKTEAPDDGASWTQC
jgi:hypothetical protein